MSTSSHQLQSVSFSFETQLMLAKHKAWHLMIQTDLERRFDCSGDKEKLQYCDTVG